MKKTKVCHLSSVHLASDTRVFHKNCKALSEAGYEVVLIVQHDHDEIIDGIQIRALKKPTNRFWRMTTTVWQLYRQAMKENAAVYHLHSPELMPVGLLLKLKRKTIIYDAHEDLPKQILHKLWIKPFLRRTLSRVITFVEKHTVARFDAVITVAPPLTERFSTYHANVVEIRNYPLLQYSKIKSRKKNNAMIYVGSSIAKTRGIFEMLTIAEKLKQPLILIGEPYPKNLIETLQKHSGWQYVTHLGHLPHPDIYPYLEGACLGFNLLYPTANYLEAIPTKIFEYMLSGIPVITSDFDIHREFIEKNNCGYCIEPTDVDTLIKKITYLLAHPKEAKKMGENGRKAVLEKYNWDIEKQKLLRLYGETS